MKILKVNALYGENRSTWSNFLLKNNGSFLQSWEWGSFQEALGKKVWRLAVEEAGQVLVTAQIIKETFPLAGKSSLYLPFGPTWQSNLLETQAKEALSSLWQKAKEIAKAENAILLLMEPLKNLPPVSGFDIRQPLKRVQPQKTLLLDLTQPAEKIFSNLQHKTTRYNIRFAEKQGVQFVEAEPTPVNLDIFNNLLRKTTQRDAFKTYPKQYFIKLFNQMSGNSAAGNPPPSSSPFLLSNSRKGEERGGGEIDKLCIKLYFAQYQDKVIAANIALFWAKTAVYLFAASDYQHRQLMAPYFLQWQQILLAKKMDCSRYDFWGINEKKWPGLTYFKKSFGGQELIYPQGQDIVFQPSWYNLYRLFRKTMPLFTTRV